MILSTALHRLKYYLKYQILAKNIHSAHSPFLFKFISECIDKRNYYYAFDELNRVRENLLNNHQEIQYVTKGAKSVKLDKKASIKDITRVAISPKKYSELYFRIVQFFEAKNILELGTSLGLNTMYLAKATGGKVISIEGQKTLCDFADNLFHQNKVKNVQLIYGSFDKTISQLIQDIFFDVLFIDGNHTFEATWKYYSLLKPRMNKKSVMIIDDIYWSKDMTKAWKKITQDKEIQITLDMYRCGIIIFNTDIQHPYHLMLRY